LAQKTKRLNELRELVHSEEPHNLNPDEHFDFYKLRDLENEKVFLA